MRTKGDITVFSDGTMNVYNRSLAEELWYDYKDFAHRAAKYRKMNKKDAELSARRYERAAVFALCEFFCQVLGSWYNQGQEKGCFPVGTGEDILFVFRAFSSTALGTEKNVKDSVEDTFSKDIFSKYILEHYQEIDFKNFLPLLDSINNICKIE